MQETKTVIELKQIEDTLKQQFKPVISLTVELDDDGTTATIFLKKPDRHTYSMVSRLVSTDSVKAIESALKNMYIGGDKLDLVIHNDDALMSCESAIVEIMQKKQAIIKKN